MKVILHQAYFSEEINITLVLFLTSYFVGINSSFYSYNMRLLVYKLYEIMTSTSFYIFCAAINKSHAIHGSFTHLDQTQRAWSIGSINIQPFFDWLTLNMVLLLFTCVLPLQALGTRTPL